MIAGVLHTYNLGWSPGYSNKSNMKSQLSAASVENTLKGLYSLEFKVLFKILNLTGNNPTFIDSSGNGRFLIRLKSVAMVVSVLGAISAILAWTLYITEFILELNWFPRLKAPHKFAYDIVANDPEIPNQLKKTELTCMSVVFGSIPFFQIIGILFGWMNSYSGVEFLNNWSHFQLPISDVQVVLGRGVDQHRKIIFRITCGLYILPSAIGLTSVFLMKRPDITVEEIIFQLYLCFLMLTGESANDFKHFLDYEIITNGFDQISKSVCHEQKLGRINSTVIHNWTKSVLFVRNQTALLISHLKNVEAMFVGRCILYLTLFLFTTFNVPAISSSIFFFQLAWGLFATFQLIRLYVKTSQAERITLAEHNLSKELINVDTTVLTPECELKIKYLHYLISHKETKIRFGTYITFDRKIVLTVCSQVVTYLIVLMQFANR